RVRHAFHTPAQLLAQAVQFRGDPAHRGDAALFGPVALEIAGEIPCGSLFPRISLAPAWRFAGRRSRLRGGAFLFAFARAAAETLVQAGEGTVQILQRTVFPPLPACVQGFDI